jgi:hypothetical protein
MVTVPHDAYPDLTVPYHYDFAETTNSRALQLVNHVDSLDLPVVVSWSGGIDSTVILAALVKNWPPSLLDRVVVKMNSASYFENPWFFDRIIVPHKFKIQQTLDNWETCFMLTGSCADSLWVQADVVELEIIWPGSSQWSMIDRKDVIIQWISQKSSWDTAHVLYDMVLESSQRAGLNLTTIEDFYWWWNFNFVYTGQLYKYLNDYQSSSSKIDLAAWHHQHLGWYHSDAYQSWSAWNRSNGVKINKTVRSYKWPAKQYIYEVDGNHWYRDYKTKMASNQKTGNRRLIRALWNDGSVLI